MKFRKLQILPAVLAGIAAVTIAAGIATGAMAASPQVTPKDIAAANRVLFVGNSYLYYGDSLHNHVRRMAIAAGIGTAKDLKFKSATISGSSLDQHALASYLEPGRLGIDEPFDVVVLQGHSAAANSDKRRDRFTKAVVDFDGKIDATGARTALYMTHAYSRDHKKYDPEMIRRIEDLYVTTGNEIGALVIPVGLAFEEAYRQQPDTKFQKTFDGSHPDLIGTYLAACVTFASLYGKSPVGNEYDYYGAIDKDTAAFLQQVAETTVEKFYGSQ